jgi:hypothetical protein
MENPMADRVHSPQLYARQNIKTKALFNTIRAVITRYTYRSLSDGTHNRSTQKDPGTINHAADAPTPVAGEAVTGMFGLAAPGAV